MANPGTSPRPTKLIAAVLAATVGGLAVVVAASRFSGLPLGWFFSDPLISVLDDPLLAGNPLLGFVSVLGVMLWTVTVGVCLLAALVVHRSGGAGTVGVGFFAWPGIISAILALDDQFQLHEEVLPTLLGRGQTIILFSYVALVGGYFWWYRRSIRATEVGLLVTSGLFFAVSLGVDLVPFVFFIATGDGADVEGHAAFQFAQHLVEDGAKFIGIGFWLTYFARTAAVTLTPSAASPPPLEHAAG